MPRNTFENLEVYKLSERLADTIWDVVRGWDHFARDTVGKQIVRSADSVGANIAEGSGRGSFAENKRFVRIARASMNETQHHLRRAFRRKLLTPARVKELTAILDELAPRLNAYINSIGRGIPTRPTRSRNGRLTVDSGQE